MMNWRRYGRKQTYLIKVLSQHLPGSTENNHKELCHDDQWEMSTPKIQVRNNAVAPPTHSEAVLHAQFGCK
jgi:hypothetical protein